MGLVQLVAFQAPAFRRPRMLYQDKFQGLVGFAVNICIERSPDYDTSGLLDLIKYTVYETQGKAARFDQAIRTYKDNSHLRMRYSIALSSCSLFHILKEIYN